MGWLMGYKNIKTITECCAAAVNYNEIYVYY